MRGKLYIRHRPHLTPSPHFYSLSWSPDSLLHFLMTPRLPLLVWNVAAQWCSAFSAQKPSSWRCGPLVFPFPWQLPVQASPLPSPCPRSCAPSWVCSSPALVRTWGESSSWSCGVGRGRAWRRRSAGTELSAGGAAWGRSLLVCGRMDPRPPSRRPPSSPPDGPGTWEVVPVASPHACLGSSWWGSACWSSYWRQPWLCSTGVAGSWTAWTRSLYCQGHHPYWAAGQLTWLSSQAWRECRNWDCTVAQGDPEGKDWV